MAAFVRLPSGSWRAVVRRKRRYISETFKRKEDARTWATEAERQIDRGVAPTSTRVKGMKTFGQLIDLHIADMKEVGKAHKAPAGADPQEPRHAAGPSTPDSRSPYPGRCGAGCAET